MMARTSPSRFFFYEHLRVYTIPEIEAEIVYMQSLVARMEAERDQKGAVWIDPKQIKKRYLDKLTAELERRTASMALVAT